MKWILMLPIMATCLIGAAPVQIEHSTTIGRKIYEEPINTKIDSINLKLVELKMLLK